MEYMVNKCQESGQRASGYKVLKMVKDKDISIRVCMWNRVDLVFEMVKNYEPVGYIKVDSAGVIFRCSKVKKNKTCSYYLDFGEWERIKLD